MISSDNRSQITYLESNCIISLGYMEIFYAQVSDLLRGRFAKIPVLEGVAPFPTLAHSKVNKK